MIEAVDKHLVDRLSRIKVGGQPVAVYGPAQTRPPNKKIYPCLSLSRYMDPVEDPELARPYLDKFVPSEELEMLTIKYQPAYCKVMPDGKDLVLSGPKSWTVRKYPTPVKLFYQLDIEATTDADILSLTRMLFRALPMPYAGQVNEIWFKMRSDGPPATLDTIEKPIFRTARRYIVTNVWEEREDIRTVPGITKFDTGIEVTNR